ncbi:MAG: alpha-L-rhamnosidase C-terminal domain-containing protein [Verrucomicrobiota bacterium]
MASMTVISLLPTAAPCRSLLIDGTASTSPAKLRAGADNPWSAEWIGPAGGAGQNSWICYRTEIDCPKLAKKVEARIACDSKYWLWINGRLVIFEGQLKRGPTPQDTYYDRVDITGNLVAGRNTIAVLVWYFGKPAFSHHSSGTAGLVFEADLGSVRIESGSNWKSQLHPAFGQTADRNPNYRLAEGNVKFDARLDILRWTDPHYNDAAWPRAVSLGRPPCVPWNQLIERPIPQWRNSGLQPYLNDVNLPRVSDGQPITGRLPANIQVTPWLEVEAPAGQTILMNTERSEMRGEYITREGRQAYESIGWMNGEQVTYHIPAGIKILGLKYRETGYDADRLGRFTSSDPVLNHLWTKAERTLYLTMRDSYMDCPDRERAQWWGDEVIELGMAFYVFDPIRGPQLARKGILELANWQRSDNTLYCPIPAGVPADPTKGGDPHTGTWDLELPTQMLASVGWYGFWTYYWFTGDRETIATVYPAVRRYLSLWQQTSDGQAVHRHGGWDWSDWGKDQDVPVLDSAWLQLALKGASAMAPVAGHPEDVAGYEQRMADLAAGFDKAFWQGTYYQSADHKGSIDDRANALAVVAGLAMPEHFPAIREVLGTEEHASPYMEKYVLEALCLMNAPDEALARMKKRYAMQIESPLSTLWELWDGGTKNHAWSGGPLTILNEYIAGVSPGSAGWKSIRIAPQLGGLEQFATTTPTPYGPIKIAYTRNQDVNTLHVVLPARIPASITVPTRTSASIAVNGAALPNRAVTVKPADPATLYVEGGNWTLTWK